MTVGTQLAFDRLIGGVDAWAGGHPGRTVFAQAGPTKLRPRHIQWREFIPPEECRARMEQARAIVAHAGMGTILSALELGKPLLVMPRRAALGEQRNDHQLATAERFEKLGRVAVALDENDLAAKLDALEELAAGAPISPYASDRFTSVIRDFIATAGRP